MYFDPTTTDPATALASGTWVLDPERSSPELRVRGTFDLVARPAIELAIEAEEGPEARFESESVALEGEALRVKGVLSAAGESVPLDLTATVRPVGEEFEIDAHAEVDRRLLGTTDGLLGTPDGALGMPASAKLAWHGRLVRW